MKKKSHLSWTWVLYFMFMGLSILDIRFGLLGFACMFSPLLFAFFGKKKKHCSTYCPRASFLKNFLGKVSLKHTLPKPLRSNGFRNILLGLMMGMFIFSLIRTGGDISKIAAVMFRMIVVSSVMSLLMGFFYKERSWCTVCPMGYAAKLMGDGVVPLGSKEDKNKQTKSAKESKAS
ncbi:MAG: hypothetical protein PQJ59_06955 [Spirochaetales bacterium]|nr:hypothetical protein [Spirochaetales bacterium]